MNRKLNKIWELHVQTAIVRFKSDIRILFRRSVSSYFLNFIFLNFSFPFHIENDKCNGCQGRLVVNGDLIFINDFVFLFL